MDDSFDVSGESKPLSEQPMDGLLRVEHLYTFVLDWMEKQRRDAMGGESCEDTLCSFEIPLQGEESYLQNRYLTKREQVMFREKMKMWVVGLKGRGVKNGIEWYLILRSIKTASKDELKPSTVLQLAELANETGLSVDAYVRKLADQAEKRRQRSEKKKGGDVS